MWPYYPELLSQSVPRYTSYPTAAEFSPAVGSLAQETALAEVHADARLSLYVHIPFCHTICWYCGCNTGAAGHAARRKTYVVALLREIEMIGARLQGRGQVLSIHFGGGSPNAVPVEDLAQIVTALRKNFSGAQTALLDMELDPRTLDHSYIAALGALGLHRVSLGVQTFAPHVQKAVNRIQPFDMVKQCCAQLRAAGISAINFDLLYGLPHQSAQDIEDSIAKALSLAPDSFAVFGYAHMPSMIARQRAIDETALPSLDERFAHSALAHQLLVKAGYCAIGFDHFSKPEDRLARAQAQGRLRRNFQGFTDDPSDVLIGLGASAISDYGHVIIQNEKNSGHYGRHIMSGALAAVRGVYRQKEDAMRADIIEQLLCHGHADLSNLSDKPNIWDDLAAELEALEPFLTRGLVWCEEKTLRLHKQALPYARVVAAAFDAFRHHAATRFSQAV